MINHLYRILIIFTIAATLLMPLSAEAEPRQNLPLSNNTYTAQQSAEDLFKLGVYKVLLGDYQEAIENLSQVIRLRPSDAKAYSNKGLARSALGDYHKAIADFNQALRLDPELAIAYYNRGFVHFKLQAYQEAIADFNQAIRFDPQQADAYHCRCLIHQIQGNKQGVIEDFQKAANLYLQQGKLQEYEVFVSNIKQLDRKATHTRVF